RGDTARARRLHRQGPPAQGRGPVPPSPTPRGPAVRVHAGPHGGGGRGRPPAQRRDLARGATSVAAAAARPVGGGRLPRGFLRGQERGALPRVGRIRAVSLLGGAPRGPQGASRGRRGCRAGASTALRVSRGRGGRPRGAPGAASGGCPRPRRSPSIPSCSSPPASP